MEASKFFATVIVLAVLYAGMAKGNDGRKTAKNRTKRVGTDGINETGQAARLNMKQGLTMNQILSVYALTASANSSCKNQSLEFVAGLRAFEPWALKMFDSSSKLQSGILLGNLVEYGSFQQCIRIYVESKGGPIKGKHCTMKISPDTFLLKKILSYRNVSEKRWDKVKIFVQNATLDWSVCIPHFCSARDVHDHFGKIISQLTEGLNISIEMDDDHCFTILDQKNLTNIEMVIVGCFVFYFMIICIVTLKDLLSNDEKPKGAAVKIFSAYQNSKQIFSKGKGKSDLDCVHGIRFLSTCYVVIGHRYLMLMFFPVINSLEIMDWILYYRSTAITGGTLCVDTFFMISGMLVSLGYFEQISKGKMNWLAFYVYRYMRITVPLAVVVLWQAVFMKYFGSGPLWNDMLNIVQKLCQEYWWATILHIQNYVHPFPLCLTQAWYLTCDMQYYVLSPILLVPLAKNSLLGYANYVLVYILSVASNFYFAWINKYNGGVPVTNQLFSTKYFQHHYIAPHTRAATYIIGIGFGYAVFKTKGNHIKLSAPLVLFGWVVSIASMLSSLVGCHVFFTEDHDYNRIESTIFLSISRSSWTLGLVWIVWACINGYGGPINFVLSLHAFRILGRISYGMYLLHMGMQYMTSGAAKTPGYFSDFCAVYGACSDLFIVAIIGFVFTICFESPLVRTLSFVFKGGEKNDAKVAPKV